MSESSVAIVKLKPHDSVEHTDSENPSVKTVVIPAGYERADSLADNPSFMTWGTLETWELVRNWRTGLELLTNVVFIRYVGPLKESAKVTKIGGTPVVPEGYKIVGKDENPTFMTWGAQYVWQLCSKRKKTIGDDSKAVFIRPVRTKPTPVDETPLPTAPGTGVKYDEGKTRFDLLPFQSVEDVAKVLTHGAKKYAPENWRHVPDGENRYLAAAFRHIWAWKKGEKNDPETGISHLAHAACSLLFIAELEHLNKKTS